MIVDSIDRKIIQELSENAFISNHVLSKKLGISPSTVGRRLNGLIREKVIKIKAVHDPHKLGYLINALLAFDIDHNYMASALDVLKKRQDINWLSSSSGRYDAMAFLWADSTENLSMKLGEIAGIEGVRNLETFILLQTVKMDSPPII